MTYNKVKHIKLLKRWEEATLELTKGFDAKRFRLLKKYDKALNDIETFLFGERPLRKIK